MRWAWGRPSHVCHPRQVGRVDHPMLPAYRTRGCRNADNGIAGECRFHDSGVATATQHVGAEEMPRSGNPAAVGHDTGHGVVAQHDRRLFGSGAGRASTAGVVRV